MNTRVFTGPGQNDGRPSARILSVVKACPGIPLALLCRALNSQPSTAWCGTCRQYANPRKRRRAETWSGPEPLPGLAAPHQLHDPCPGLGFDNVRKSVYALANRSLLRLEREQCQDPRQPRGWDWMTCCYYQPAAHVALVGCVAQKLNYPAPARRLYTSPLFRWRLAWAEQHADRILILSAGYHLVELDRVLQPYDASLNTASKAERLDWAATVWSQLHQTLDVAETRFTLLAGKAYTTYLGQWLKTAAAACDLPLARLAIGQQLQWLKRETPKEGRP
jgi:hypothetical protein